MIGIRLLKYANTERAHPLTTVPVTSVISFFLWRRLDQSEYSHIVAVKAQKETSPDILT